MAFKGAFAAGFSRGFGETFTKGIEDRRKEREKYLDNMLNNAKAVAPAYAQSEAEVKAMEDMMAQMGADFGITPEEFIGMAQNYDISTIYKDVYSAKGWMEQNNIAGTIDKSMILGGLRIPEEFELPENVTPEMALRMIFQGHVGNLATDPANRSEGFQSGSFGAAVADVLNLNPRATAEDMAAGMQVAGVPVDKLIQFQQSGGIKATPFSGLTAEGPYVGINIDYDPSRFEQTKRNMTSELGRIFVGTEQPELMLTDQSVMETALANFRGVETDFDPRAVYDQLYQAGNTFARLEKQLIGKGLSLGMGERATRADIMSGVASRFESMEELQTFVSAVERGDPVVDRMLKAYSEDYMITDKEMDYILYGEDGRPEETDTGGDTGGSGGGTGGGTGGADGDMKQGAMGFASRFVGRDSIAPGADVTSSGPDMAQPDVQNQELVDIIASTADDTAGLGGAPKGLMGQAIDTLTGTTEFTEPPNAQEINDAFIERSQANAANYTWEEYQSMSREERKEKGLPVRPIDSWAAYGVMKPYEYFKDGKPIKLDTIATDSEDYAEIMEKVVGDADPENLTTETALRNYVTTKLRELGYTSRGSERIPFIEAIQEELRGALPESVVGYEPGNVPVPGDRTKSALDELTSAVDILADRDSVNELLDLSKAFLDEMPTVEMSEIDNQLMSDYLTQNGYKAPSQALLQAFKSTLQATYDMSKTQ